jgi:hypothetical protein
MTIPETILSSTLIAILGVTGYALLEDTITTTQAAVMNIQMGAAADCAQLSFAMNGVDAAVGVQAALDDPHGEIAADLLDCYRHTGLSTELVLDDPDGAAAAQVDAAWAAAGYVRKP